MKALSLTQPWATLVAVGAKRIETRSWSTKHRGPIALHAARRFPKECVLRCAEEPFYSALMTHRDAWRNGLPTGCLIALATVWEVLPTSNLWNRRHVVAHATEHEQAFGDYAGGRFAWLLTEVRPLSEPIPCKGALGLWMVPAGIYEAVERQLRAMVVA